MIKRFTYFLAAFLCLTPSAFAASKIKSTQGSYLEIDLVKMKSTEQVFVTTGIFDDSSTYVLKEDPTASGTGLGLSYKYAFTFKDTLVYPFSRLYLAPGIFYENVKNTAQDKLLGNEFTLSDRYGAKVDIGWDFDYGIATYVVGGISSLKYDVKWTNYNDSVAHASDPSYPVRTSSVSGTSYAMFYGLGLAYSPLKHLTLNLEYNYQKNTINASPEGGYEATGVVFNKIINRSQIIKLGMALHF